jgi:hypothetical protein
MSLIADLFTDEQIRLAVTNSNGVATMKGLLYRIRIQNWVGSDAVHQLILEPLMAGETGPNVSAECQQVVDGLKWRDKFQGRLAGGKRTSLVKDWDSFP